MSNRRNPFVPSTYFQASSNNGGDVDRERVYDSKIMGWEDESSGRVSPVHRFSIVLGARVAPLARCVTLAPGRSAAGPSEWLTVAKNTVAEADPPIAQPSRTRPRCLGDSSWEWLVRQDDAALTYFFIPFCAPPRWKDPLHFSGETSCLRLDAGCDSSPIQDRLKFVIDSWSS